MMCYRDVTWCKFDTCMKWLNCKSALNNRVQDEADRWWGKGAGKAPICTYIDRPDCYLDRGNVGEMK